ncbi:preprotein translocase subunit SecG [Yoonia sp. 208BN28-4]|uniref:preprotein translocase subunit SecG n=1 Tax=Yoonia sp. 208BN28-4 TaxID=3126505 RepID=UPI0030B71545
MENVILVIHLILALSLIGAVLMQRSEGGGLGIGGGGGGAGASRPPQSAAGKFTWILAIAFICTSIALTLIAADQSAGASVLDRLSDQPAAEEQDTTVPGLGDDLLPPSSDDAPLVPSGN